MRTQSQSRRNSPQQEASPVIVEPLQIELVIIEPLRIELPFLEDQFQEDPPPEVLMADNRTMAELLLALTEGYEDAIEDPPPEVLMADNRTMAELLLAPTEGYEDTIVIPEIAAKKFELKHGLINLVHNSGFKP
uniref:Reverse transcriptase domain-containing protein n=1 Tax=Tanacetum cinerariifolium TaxID=118510 RepID=A0A699JHP1_TANCI|nr:reverse transcriptase domain-containing protein [Tanacetum cinerariifolium]